MKGFSNKDHILIALDPWSLVEMELVCTSSNKNIFTIFMDRTPKYFNFCTYQTSEEHDHGDDTWWVLARYPHKSCYAPSFRPQQKFWIPTILRKLNSRLSSSQAAVAERIPWGSLGVWDPWCMKKTPDQRRTGRFSFSLLGPAVKLIFNRVLSLLAYCWIALREAKQDAELFQTLNTHEH